MMPHKEYTEICDKEQSLERQSRRWNGCEERNGIHRFVVLLFEGANNQKFEGNTEERTASSWTRKPCKHDVGYTKRRNGKDFTRDHGEKGTKCRHNQWWFCNWEDNLHYRNKNEALPESKECLGVRSKDKSTMLYNYNNKNTQTYSPHKSPRILIRENRADPESSFLSYIQPTNCREFQQFELTVTF